MLDQSHSTVQKVVIGIGLGIAGLTWYQGVSMFLRAMQMSTQMGQGLAIMMVSIIATSAFALGLLSLASSVVVAEYLLVDADDEYEGGDE